MEGYVENDGLTQLSEDRTTGTERITEVNRAETSKKGADYYFLVVISFCCKLFLT